MISLPLNCVFHLSAVQELCVFHLGAVQTTPKQRHMYSEPRLQRSHLASSVAITTVTSTYVRFMCIVRHGIVWFVAYRTTKFPQQEDKIILF